MMHMYIEEELLMNSRFKRIVFSKIPSPFEANTLYWLDVIPFVGYFLIRNFDIHLRLKAENPYAAKLMVMLLPLLFAIPVLDLWTKGYGVDSESYPETEKEHYRRSIRKRIGFVVAAVLVILIYNR